MNTGVIFLGHGAALSISSNVTRNIRRLQGRTKVDIQPKEVIKILNKAKIKFTLVGGSRNRRGGFSTLEASQDVDFIIHAQHKKAVQAMHRAYPELRVEDIVAVTRFIDPATDRPVIDLMKPCHSDLHQAAPCPTTGVRVGRSHRDAQVGDGAGPEVRRHGFAQPQ